MALAAVLGILALSRVGLAVTSPPPVSQAYVNRFCPDRCSDSESDGQTWSLYHNLGQLDPCPETIFHHFSLFDPVDDEATYHRIFACTSFGQDWLDLPSTVRSTSAPPQANQINATFRLQSAAQGGADALDLFTARQLATELGKYLTGGHGSHENAVRVFARRHKTVIGLYIGEDLQPEELVGPLALFADYLRAAENATEASMQMCNDKILPSQTFGILTTSGDKFGALQDAIKTWQNGSCLASVADNHLDITRQISVPSWLSSPAASNGTLNGTRIAPNSTIVARALHQASPIQRRDDGACRVERVEKEGQGCPEMATKCGISGYDFMRFNSGDGFCSKLRPGSPVCCSAGKLPDVRPKPNADGSCKWTTVHGGQSCDSLAAENGLLISDIENFNQKTWAWNGCNTLWAETRICLSSGTPPPPAVLPKTDCGPQAPKNDHSSPNVAEWNPCPLNACCDMWGYCGTTAEFCTDTSLGPPGTARPGTISCISNCGTDIKQDKSSSTWRSIGYFEGFNLHRNCLFQDASQIDTTKFSHIHFAFGDISHDYQVSAGDALTAFQFDRFKALPNRALRIMSFGGWEFSTSPSTYTIFRDGVAGPNRMKLAQNLAKFVLDNNLDGIDIDWEYPGAPDIPGIPPASDRDGWNYFYFLSTLRQLLPNKSISIAAPSSYWYLRGFPIAQISTVVDYIVYMTYDLHGQWDADSKWSQEGCPSGRCLRSGVNLTETLGSLALITKAGVSSSKVVVGITSYGRSHGMADGNCDSPDCFFTGGKLDSTATPGRCTGSAGYIANAEIYEILNTPGRVKKQYVDRASHSNILVYDNNQWVGYMDARTRLQRIFMYQSLSMGGVTNWAIDLETFNEFPSYILDPSPSSSSGSSSWGWNSMKDKINSGINFNPQRGDRHGNWTSLNCNDPAVLGVQELKSSERWARMDAADAWQDAVNYWFDHDRADAAATNFQFSKSISNTLHGTEDMRCADMSINACRDYHDCFERTGSGPAAYFVLNSMVNVHVSYVNFAQGIVDAMAVFFNPTLDAFMDNFAPLPDPDDSQKWLDFMFNMLTMGATAGFGFYFNSILRQHLSGSTGDNFKDGMMALISGALGIAKDMRNKDDASAWSVKDQHQLKDNLGKFGGKLYDFAVLSLKKLFDGTPDSVTTLTSILSEGKMMSVEVPSFAKDNDQTASYAKSIATMLFGYAIPFSWRQSKQAVFIMDTGSACTDNIPSSLNINPDAAKAGAGCVNGKLYILTMVPANTPVENCGRDGDHCHKDETCQIIPCRPNAFQAPPGLSLLGKDHFAGITAQKLIEGALNTQNAGGKDLPVPDINSYDSVKALAEIDLTVPGLVHLPICTHDHAREQWSAAPFSAENFPCSDRPH